MPIEQLKQLQDAAPAAMTVLLIAALVVGAILWLSGKRLARPACAVSGLLLGGLGGWALANQIGEGGYMLPFMIGAAIVGALVAAFLFRVWMGLTGALILAVLVPAASLVWQGTTPPTLELTEEDLPALTEAAEEGFLTQLTDAGRAAYEEQRELIHTWWEGMGTAVRTLIIIGAVGGAFCGLLIGLVQPHFSAAVQSALIGAILIFMAGRQLLLHFMPDQTGWLPTTPRGSVLTIGLITVAGLVIQWTLFRRSTDKE